MFTSKTILSAKLFCTFDDQHPDWKYLSDEQKRNGETFEDTYTFDHDWWDQDDIESMAAHAKGDLMLIAGGGYDCDHIHNIKFSYEKKF